MNKIDFVLPWVDGSDPTWQAKKNAQLSTRQHLSAQTENNNARYRDMGTLKYVLRGIEKNCPWYNKIFLITEGHHPTWLNINHPKIKLVTHKELYFDANDLPTFNSNSIEMNLSNLEGVSEKFVYLNDDSLIINKVGIDRFFKNDLPVDFLCHGWLPRKKLLNYLGRIDAWVHSINNNIELINKYKSPQDLDNKYLFNASYSLVNRLANLLFLRLHNRYFWLEHWHHPQAYTKKNIDAVYTIFKKDIDLTSKSKFRSANDITVYLYRYWHLSSGQFYPLKHNDSLIENIDKIETLDSLINKINNMNNKIKFACFNDSPSLSDGEYENIKNKLIFFLDSLFPEKASFEN